MTEELKKQRVPVSCFLSAKDIFEDVRYGEITLEKLRKLTNFLKLNELSSVEFDWNGRDMEYDVYFYRDETDEEFEERKKEHLICLKKEEENKRKNQEEQRKKDEQEFERLRLKLGK